MCGLVPLTLVVSESRAFIVSFLRFIFLFSVSAMFTFTSHYKIIRPNGNECCIESNCSEFCIIKVIHIRSHEARAPERRKGKKNDGKCVWCSRCKSYWQPIEESRRIVLYT